jgi:hypothetical protein
VPLRRGDGCEFNDLNAAGIQSLRVAPGVLVAKDMSLTPSWLVAALALMPATTVLAQSPAAPAAQSPASPVACESKAGDRTHCNADTSGGVVLVRSTGTAECLLGKTWGYDQTGVWVSEGCSAEFMLGQPAGAAAPTATPAPAVPPERKPFESWGEFSPGDGFTVGRSSAGSLSISGYALVRYMNQMPGEQTFTDHLGNTRSVDGRNDIYSHRVMVFFKGWLGSPRLIYAITLWTVNTTDQRAIFANLGYQFSRKFSVYAGLNGNPGTRSLQGSHPYWLAPDRVMADEFFRPFFGSGIWAQGEIAPGLWYNGVMTNNNSSLGTKATQLDRSYTTGASMWWMPTTKEFGPRGAYGDWEQHEKVATRFGFSTTRSPEERFTDAVAGNSTNTTLRLADSVNVFETGALARGVTIDRVNYRILSFDAGVKYRGIFLQTEIYNRWLDGFKADGALPVTSVHDTGFYVQGAFYPIPKKLELYAVTSQIFGDKGAGFSNSSEYLAGFNFYPANTRNHRFNLQVIDVNRSPASSTFGYYVGGQKGTTVSAAFSVFF